MSEEVQRVLTIVAAVIGGGAMGAFITQWFRSKAARTSTIPLIELVINRDSLLHELKGVKLIPEEAGPEVTDIRHYQFLLRNTYHAHLL